MVARIASACSFTWELKVTEPIPSFDSIWAKISSGRPLQQTPPVSITIKNWRGNVINHYGKPPERKKKE